MKYIVTVSQALVWLESVEADSLAEAKKKARNCDILETLSQGSLEGKRRILGIKGQV